MIIVSQNIKKTKNKNIIEKKQKTKNKNVIF